MSDGPNGNGTDKVQPAFLPPLIKSLPPSLRRYDPDDPTPRGDQSITLDEEDERILDKVWAEVARHPRMAADPDATLVDGQTRHPGGRRKGAGHRRMPVRNAEAPVSKA